MTKYEQWIKDNVTNSYGKCHEYCLEMQKVFPELQLVRGHYYCLIWGKREHWWLKINDTVVDPTKDQFPTKGTGNYIELDSNEPEPTGRCPNCGEYCYDNKYLCSDYCEKSYLVYLNSGVL